MLSPKETGSESVLLTQIFTQMYPNPECSPMHARFAAAYREASAQEDTPKMGPMSARVDGGVRVAVA